MKKRITTTEVKIRGITLDEKAAIEMMAYTRGISLNQLLKETVSLLATEQLTLTLETMQSLNQQMKQTTGVLERVDKLLREVGE